MRVIIAEKPSVARDIARTVGAKTRREGYLEGSGYLITWAVGHLCDIAPPDKQSKDWRKWTLDSLPMIPARFRLEVLPKTKAQYNTLVKLFNDPAVSELVVATDAGREGELIFRRIYQMARCRKPFQRLWLSSMTDEAIRHALDDIKPGQDFNNLAAAAYARAESDWLIGMNDTRAFTLKCGGELVTVGRVQTPVLAMLVERRREIENFIPQTYWEIVASFEQEGLFFKAVWHEPPKLKNTRILEQEKADQILSKCQGHPARVESIAQKKGQSRPPLLYDLTTLQRACNARFGFPAKKTLAIAQDLYEKQKLITYPRTDSQYISRDVFKQIAGHFRAIRSHYDYLIGRLRLCFEQNPDKYRVVDDARVTDHHAIIPTTKQADISKLTTDQAKVYDMVCRRLMAAFLPAAEFRTTELWLDINGEKFKAQGKVFENPGWLEAEPWALAADSPLPRLSREQVLNPKDLKRVDKKTKPPPHYTDATLLRAMETAGRLIEDEELAQAMKERGLGTPATRAQIIEALLEKKTGVRRAQGQKHHCHRQGRRNGAGHFGTVAGSAVPRTDRRVGIPIKTGRKRPADLSGLHEGNQGPSGQRHRAGQTGRRRVPEPRIGLDGRGKASVLPVGSWASAPCAGEMSSKPPRPMDAPTGERTAANSPSGRIHSAAGFRRRPPWNYSPKDGHPGN